MENGNTPTAIFRATYPLDFSFSDENDQPILYIEGDTIGHNLDLIIHNRSVRTIHLTPAPNTAVSRDNFHFELRFRPGTLSDAPISIAQSNWMWQHVSQADGTDSLYLLFTPGHAIEPDTTLTLTLQNVSAAAGGGARGTRVALRYQQLTTDTGDGVSGTRLQHVTIVNQRGRRNIPLHVGFVGSNQVLNNTTTNALTLRITNTLRDAPFIFNHETRFILSFDADDTPGAWIMRLARSLRSPLLW